MRTVNVLVTSAGAGPAIAVLKALRQQRQVSVRLIAADMDPTAPGLYLCDQPYIVPQATDATFLPRIRKICDREQIDAVIPIYDSELAVFSRAKGSLESAGMKVLVNPIDVVERANDKRQAHEHCLALSIPVPRLYSVAEIESGTVTLPLIVKPRQGIGSQGIQVVWAAEMLARLQLTDQTLVQEYLDGDEYTVDTLSDGHGKCLVAVPRLRMSVKSGQMVKGRVVADPELMRQAYRVVEGFGVTGAACLQVKVRQGIPYFIELNPRYGTGLSLTVGAGANLPLLELKQALNMPIEPAEWQFQDGVTLLRYWEEIILPASGLVRG